jgi:hypothetical protein
MDIENPSERKDLSTYQWDARVALSLPGFKVAKFEK